MDKAILTCALTGVLTNPKQHPVPVTPAQMAQEARDAFNAGASIMHVHLRMQEEGLGHMPSWDPDVAESIVNAIRAACPGVIINLTTGVVGKDISGPLACIRRVKPEIAACNAGSLNYLKIKDDGQWAWPPMVFDNPVTKVQQFLDVMQECHVHPEFECFDVGIVRSVGMFLKNGMLKADMGRAEIWPVHQKTAELGGMLRTGLEDTFYLPDGQKASGNGVLIAALADCARKVGRGVASPAEARALLGLRHGTASA